MFDIDTSRLAFSRDSAILVAQLDTLPDREWDTPLACAGWTVRDLARHLVGASRGLAEGVRRRASQGGVLAQLTEPDHGEKDAIMAALRQGLSELEVELAALAPHDLDAVAPIPFGHVPVGLLLQIIPVEFGFHRLDLAPAIGEPEHVREDTAAAVLDIVPGLLPAFAAGTPVFPTPGAIPTQPVAFQFTSCGWRLAATFDDEGWQIESEVPNGTSRCDISGDPDIVAQFLMGRVPATDGRLRTNDVALAGMFKSYFPGP